MNMTEKQKLFLKILKSGKYSKNWRDWDNLDKISEFICKLGYWQANYRELFGEKKLLGNLPAIDVTTVHTTPAKGLTVFLNVART